MKRTQMIVCQVGTFYGSECNFHNLKKGAKDKNQG